MDPNATRILPEILLHIFSHLPVSDIDNVSQVSREWRFWSQKQLYSKPSLVEISSVALFLRTLLTPGLECLAAYVRNLTVISSRVNAETMDQSNCVIIERANARLGLDHHVVAPGEHILLLLHLLPRLDVLTLNILHGHDTLDDFLCGTHEPEDLPPAFRSIRRFSYTWLSRESKEVSQKLLTMFTLPRVRTLVFYALDGIVVSFPTHQHKTSVVTTLLISKSMITISSLGHMLQLPHALTRMSIINSITYDTNLTGLQAALEPLRMTLQELELVITYYRLERRLPPPVSFRTWPVLRRLRCQTMFLLGCTYEKELHYLEDVLPPTIRDFGVITENDWYFNDLARKLIHLVGKKQMVVPVLERLSCFTGWMDVEVAQQLHLACVDAAVVLTKGW